MAGSAQAASDISVPPRALSAQVASLVGAAPQEVTTSPKHHWIPPNWEKLALLTFAVCFLLTLIVLAIKFPEPKPFQLTVFRVILSLAAAGIAASIPGLIEFEIKPGLRAGGALAVFAIIYFINPGQLVLPRPPRISIGERKHRSALRMIRRVTTPTVRLKFPLSRWGLRQPFTRTISAFELPL